jgi:hypothetical protein
LAGYSFVACCSWRSSFPDDALRLIKVGEHLFGEFRLPLPTCEGAIEAQPLFSERNRLGSRQENSAARLP